MKRAILLTLTVIVVLSIGTAPVYAGSSFSLSLSGNYLMHSNSDFKDIYGNGTFYPELGLGFKIMGPIYIWARVGALSASGETPILKADAKANQFFGSGGAGIIFKVAPKITLKGRAGLMFATWKEEALDLELDGTGFGFRLDGELDIHLAGGLYAGLTVGYMSATDKVDENLKAKLGGFRTGIVLGFGF